jgi:hypothetical protein
VYLFSTLDDPRELSFVQSAILTPNSRASRSASPAPGTAPSTLEDVILGDVDSDDEDEDNEEMVDVDDDEVWEDESNADDEPPAASDTYSRVPAVPPRARYIGAANVQTVKDGTRAASLIHKRY